jgi:hypothetical protein
MTREDYYGAGNVATHNNWNDAASTTATSVTTKKTRLLSIDAQNSGAAAAFLRIYDKAAAPDPATDEPKMTFMIPAGGGKVNEKNMALQLASGFAYAITAGEGTTDDTDLTNADEVVVNFEYFDRF